jgi:hypothetical protein
MAIRDTSRSWAGRTLRSTPGDGGGGTPGDAVDETGGTPAAPSTATSEQLAEAPNSTAARSAAGDLPQNPQGNTPVDPATVDTGQRKPLTEREQSQTGAPGGVDGDVIHESTFDDPEVAKRARAAQEVQQQGLFGTGRFVVFNTTRSPLTVDVAGHLLDGKARRRVETLDDAVTAAAIGRGDLVNETLTDD